jgi:MinD-like ATPase involved in chromosome partitioning or flagellar assembly
VGVIAFASAKSSPGVTTTIAALAATWPADRDLHIVEVDPAGGDLVVRFEMAPEPGLVTLAATGRRDLGPETYLGHTQALPSDVGADGPARRILVAPVAADQASAALGALRGGLPKVLAQIEADVLVDCGRLDPYSPAFEFATQADLLVVVTRPILSEIHHLAARLPSVRARAVSLLVVGDSPYGVTDVASVVEATPLGTIPDDDRAARALTLGHPHALRVLRRSRLLRDARSVAEGLAAWLGPPHAATRPTAPPPAPGGHAPGPGSPVPAGPPPAAPGPGGPPFDPGPPVGYEAPPPAPYGPPAPPPPPEQGWPAPPPPPAPPGRPGAMPPYGDQGAGHPEPAPAAAGHVPPVAEPPRAVPWPSRPWTNGGGRGDTRGGNAKHFRRSDEDDER